tara:strand:- start:28536 stop:29513 length:978 start_codon:yes stop_codon:yes gene_type:complete
MKGVLIFIARVLVAFTFLYSGFVKLVDPLGSSYKFEEYFGADVLNLEFLIPYTIPFSILLILVEIMLGITLLLGYKPKFTIWSLVGITLLFLFLTWYSAFYNKVTDCGCFGDALKLSPWDTFYKNVILLLLLGPLLINNGTSINSVFSDRIMKHITFLFLGVFVFITYYVLVHLPIIDFRAYAIGKNIQQGMQYTEGNDDLPPVHDFFLETETEDLTNVILSAEKSMLIVSYNLDEGSIEGFVALQEVADRAKKDGYLVYAVSAASIASVQLLKKELSLSYEFLFCDETTLKTIIRANPGVVTLEKGTVVGKWNWRDADAVFGIE